MVVVTHLLQYWRVLAADVGCFVACDREPVLLNAALNFNAFYPRTFECLKQLVKVFTILRGGSSEFHTSRIGRLWVETPMPPPQVSPNRTTIYYT
eukprot:5000778-Amphidinium_carterae.1